jgi:short-subunit dehydrogenase
MLRYTKDMDPLHHRLSENLAQMAVIAETINADVHKMERRNKVHITAKRPLVTVYKFCYHAGVSEQNSTL